MKKLIYIMLFAILSSCSGNRQANEKNMRRFTFAAFDALSDTIAFHRISASEKTQAILKKSGVENFNYCTSDSISFLVLDMEESLNLNETKSIFKSLSVKNPELALISEIINGDYLLLPRIYKMEQAAEYQPEEGQLIPYHKDSYARFILTLEIVNDPALAKEYVAVHGIGKAWPEITQNMKTVGIHEMELYLMGYRAFLIMDTKADFDWDVDGEKWGSLPREKEWQAHVARFQKTDPESKAAEKWKTMDMISMTP